MRHVSSTACAAESIRKRPLPKAPRPAKFSPARRPPPAVDHNFDVTCNVEFLFPWNALPGIFPAMNQYASRIPACVALLLAFAVTGARAQIIIDDFSNDNALSNYVQAVVLNVAGSADTRNFSTTNGPGDALYIDYNQASGNGNARQWAYLRNDYFLGTNGYVELDVRILQQGAFANQPQTFLGVTINTTLNPTNRVPQISLVLNAQGQIQYFNTNGSQVGLNVDLAENTNDIYTLRISRAVSGANNIFSASYSVNNGAFTNLALAITNSLAAYDPVAVGFYTGNSRNTSDSILLGDDLGGMLTAIPEPSSVVLFLGGAALAAFVSRRNRAGRS